MTTRMARASRPIAGAAALWLLTTVGAPVLAQQAAPTPAPTPGPAYTDAMKAIATAHAAGARMNVKLTCAVVDSRGDLVALGRMDGARFFTADVARGKALTSALFGQPSGAMAQFGNSPAFPGFNAAAQGRMFPIQGALPIMKSSQVLGAIGCSGGSSQQDEDAARAGLGTL